MTGPTSAATRVRTFRGEILSFRGDPALLGERAVEHFADGLLVVRDGAVAALGPWAELAETLAPDEKIVDYTGKLILPGFVDTHTHYAQTDVVASDGEQLLEWLKRHTYPAERRFEEPAHASAVARFFVDELLCNGTTTAMVYATVHPHSADAIFAAAEARKLRLLAGKAMMDRNCPEYLRDTAQSSYDDSKTLIERWHGRGRLGYVVTPRFAGSSSEEQLRLAGRLLDEHPGVFLQSHVAENRAEVAWIAELFPESRSYLDVYDRYGLLRERAMYGHCIWLDDTDRRRMGETGAAMSFCPTSNLFLGSGLFDVEAALRHGVRVGIGTDIGGGTSFSMLRTLDEAYKVSQLAGRRLAPLRAFYLATLGGAHALYLDDRIGSLAPGREADFVVLDPAATPLLARRMQSVRSLEEKLSVLMVLGDDRAVAATHVLGECAYARASA